MAKKRVNFQYRGHTIIANAGGAMVHPQKHLIEGSSIEESVENAKAYINSKYSEREKQRVAPHIGTVDDYAEALNALKLGSHELAMLSAHYSADERRLTAAELAKSAGWNDFSSANSHYGRLGKRIAEQVGLNLDGCNEQVWTEALAVFDEETREWIMHDNLAEALFRLNMT